MFHADRSTVVRTLTVTALLPCALALPAAAAGAAAQPNKAAIEYGERVAQPPVGGTKAQIENEEMRGLREAAPSVTAPVPADDFPWAAALSGLGAAAVVTAGGVLLVRRHHAVPLAP